MFCQECGVEAKGGKFCINCGFDLVEPDQNESFTFSNDAKETPASLTPDERLTASLNSMTDRAKAPETPKTYMSDQEVVDNGKTAARVIGWLLLFPTVILTFPTWTFITDGQCHWVTVVPDLTFASITSDNSLYCMYAVDEYAARAEANYYGLATDTLWLSYSVYLVLFASLWVTTFLLVRAGRKKG